ncbi:MAG TPA: CAP domain-containing protein [Candidatus Acidoferrales bacterium]|nr:CAP domain-containing protein [Candidatus Acidoferrales bacterium]
MKFSIVAFLAFVLVAGIASAQEKIAGAEGVLFNSANHERASRGIPPLKWDSALAKAARFHARRMADENALAHQFAGEPDVPTREMQAGEKMSEAAENVAVGPSAAAIQTGWMHSPPHRHNLLDPQLNSVGIAVVQRGQNLFAVEDFSRALAALSLTDQENVVSTSIHAAGLTIRSDHRDARRVCQGGRPQSAQPGFIEQFSTTDLRALPEALTRAVHSDQYHSAQIGACAKPSQDGLSQYHIAVLLY